MTYQELVELMQRGGGMPFSYEVAGTGGGESYIPGRETGQMFFRDPGNPLGGTLQVGADGGLYYSEPFGSGVNFSAFAPDGTPINSGFSDSSRGWQDSLLGAVGTLGGAALGANAIGGLMGAAPAAAAVPPAAAPAAASAAVPGAASGMGAGSGIAGAIDGMMAGTIPAAGVGALGAGAAATAPAWASLLGSGASGLLSNPSLLAAGLGAAAGIAGNSDMTTSSNTTQTSRQSLDPWLQSAAQDFVGRAQGLAGSTTNANLQTAGGLLSNLATQGDPLVNAARGQQQNLIGGGMLGANPFINNVASDTARIMGENYAVGTRAGQMGAASQSGNWDSAGARQALGMRDEAFARGLGTTIGGLLNNNYQFERGAQDNASRASLGFGQFGANNAMNLGNFGQAEWQRPFAANQAFGSAINPAFGSTTNASGTQSQNINAPNNVMAGLGGAAMGAGIFRSLFPQTR